MRTEYARVLHTSMLTRGYRRSVPGPQQTPRSQSSVGARSVRRRAAAQSVMVASGSTGAPTDGTRSLRRRQLSEGTWINETLIHTRSSFKELRYCLSTTTNKINLKIHKCTIDEVTPKCLTSDLSTDQHLVPRLCDIEKSQLLETSLIKPVVNELFWH